MHSSTRVQEGFKFGGVVLPKIKISVFGAKMLSSPETPGFEHSGGNSGYRPGNSGLGSADTPDFWGMFWARECNFLCKLLVVASSHWLF